MKRFYLIIFLLLLPLCRAEGQTFNLHLVGDPLPYSFEWDCSHNGGPYFDSMQMTGTIPVSFDLSAKTNVQDLLVSFSVPSQDTTLSFTVDTDFHALRKFTLLCVRPDDTAAGERSRYGIVIDSVPYTGDVGTVINTVPGRYFAKYVSVFSLSTSNNGYTCDGGTSNQGTTWVTTLDLIYSSAALANVTSTEQPPAAFRVIPTPEGLIARYTSSEFIRTIEITNSIGVSCQKANISPGSEAIQLPPLPRGCYFARMGNQIAKFYVLP